MLTITGFEDNEEMARELFTLMAVLEMYNAAYIEADCYYSGSVYVPTNPRDRLLGYL
jgi:hypothetical protein